MKDHKDIYDMSDNEFDEYISDLVSGYAFDPDNKILDADKNLPLKNFFEITSERIKDLAVLPDSTMENFAEVASRVRRLGDWFCGEMEKMSVLLQEACFKKISDDMRNNKYGKEDEEL